MAAIFFDLDGTLFDTRADLAATVNHTRRDLGLSELSEKAVLAFVGCGARHLLDHAIPERKGEDVQALFRGRYAEHCCERLTPYPGVLETLAELNRRGHRLGVNTNKPGFATRAILAKFGLSGLFGEAVVAGGDGFPLKPDPASIRACAARMSHALSSEDWMVGDSWTDLRCAEAAGVKSAFCAFGFGSRAGAACTVCLDCFRDLLAAL